MNDETTKAESENLADQAKAASAPFLDLRLLLTILLVLATGIIITTLISTFEKNLGTISFGGTK